MRSIVPTVALCLLLFLSAPLKADSITLIPRPADLHDLPHKYYFTWGLHADEDAVGDFQVTDARLKFKSIRNWDDEPNKLYVHLLNTAPWGVRAYFDDQDGGDNFAGQGVELVTYTNLPSTSQDLTHEFTADQVGAFNDYLRDGGDVAPGRPS